MDFKEFIRMEVMAHPLGVEAYRLATEGDLDGLVALYERDKHLWPAPEVPMACKRGCSYCCHINVEIMDYEKPTLRRAINNLDDKFRQTVLDRAKAKNAITSPLTEEERYNKRIPCALLNEKGECSIYDDRPLSCRAFHVSDVKTCIAGSVEGSDVQTIEWRWPKEAKTHIELAVGLHQLEQGVSFDNLATTLEQFIDEN